MPQLAAELAAAMEETEGGTSRFGALATGLKPSTGIRSRLINPAKLIFFEENAGFLSEQGKQSTGYLPLLAEKVVAADTGFANTRFPLRITLHSENREAATAGPAIFAIELLFFLTTFHRSLRGLMISISRGKLRGIQRGTHHNSPIAIAYHRSEGGWLVVESR